MAGVPENIIVKYACEEHRCEIFDSLRILERLGTGELRWKRDSMVAKQEPWTDHNGKLLTHNENGRITDPSFAATDKRHIIVKTHRHATADGTPGASGKFDPKVVTVPEGIRYQPDDNWHCELCDQGDYIPPWKRHYKAKRRLSTWTDYFMIKTRLLMFGPPKTPRKKSSRKVKAKRP
jgi:hypothetical protein